jgi:hypothetical protein
MLLTNSRMDKLAAAWQEFRKLGMMDGTMAGYTAMILGGGQPQPRDSAPESIDDEDDDNGPALGPKSLSSIELARMPRKSRFILFVSNRFADVTCFRTSLPM